MEVQKLIKRIMFQNDARIAEVIFTRFRYVFANLFTLTEGTHMHPEPEDGPLPTKLMKQNSRDVTYG